MNCTIWDCNGNNVLIGFNEGSDTRSLAPNIDEML
jgi:hypothetical protein